MKFRLWSKISAIFLTFWGLESGFIAVRDVLRENIAARGVIYYNISFILWLLIIFLVWFLPYVLPSIPLWYYGFKKKN